MRSVILTQRLGKAIEMEMIENNAKIPKKGINRKNVYEIFEANRGLKYHAMPTISVSCNKISNTLANPRTRLLDRNSNVAKIQISVALRRHEKAVAWRDEHEEILEIVRNLGFTPLEEGKSWKEPVPA